MNGLNKLIDYDDIVLIQKVLRLPIDTTIKFNNSYNFKHSKQVYTGSPFILYDGLVEDRRLSAAYKVLKDNHINSLISINNISTMFKDKIYKQNQGDSVFYPLHVNEPTDNYDLFRTNMPAEASSFLEIISSSYSDTILKYIQHIRSKYPNTTIMAGNTIDPVFAKEVLDTGADIVKIGFGANRGNRNEDIRYSKIYSAIECAKEINSIGGHTCMDIDNPPYVKNILKQLATAVDFIKVDCCHHGLNISNDFVKNMDYSLITLGIKNIQDINTVEIMSKYSQ
jgi:GMP reductase